MSAPKDDPQADPSSDGSLTSTGGPSRPPLRPVAPLSPGAMLAGRFRIVALLGRGGMGEVYRAEDLKLGQAVALKFLPEPIDEVRLQRFYREVGLGRQVAHRNVCRIYELVESEGRHFLAMEYVDGEDLASLLRRIGRLSPDKALEIGRGICAGIAAAHDKGILHRDLKPANVMIDGWGQPRITDFGLAAPGDATGDGFAGTPAYMAPEQLQGAKATVSSDLYGLGLVLYEMFTGKRPVEAGSLSELVKRRSESTPSAPSTHVREIDGDVERIILRCLDRDPALRPPSARAILAALPGGDPLQAALALGETPSPQMVAAAAVTGELQPRTAWAGLGLGALLLWGVLLLADRIMLHRLAPLPKPPEVLLDRARQIAAAFTTAKVADSAHGFEVNEEYLAYARGRSAQGRWERLATEHPGPILFWYRTSPEALVARTWEPLPAGRVALRVIGRVTRQQPPPIVPGMVEVVLDPDGRLVRFLALPQEAAGRAAASLEASIARLLTEAGLDASRLAPAAPAGLLSLSLDERRAWTGEFPDAPGLPLEVQEASLGGRPVFFEVKPASPLATAASAALPPRSEAASALTVAFLLIMAAPVAVGGGLLIVRNLRSRRGDRQGAFRLALFGAGTSLVTLKLGVHYSSSWVDALDLWQATDWQAIYLAVLGWGMYIALEPAVRRTWPHTLVAWSRLLEGRLRDPLVGRDLLLGVVCGLASRLLMFTGDAVTAATGGLTRLYALPVTALGSGRATLALVFERLHPAVVAVLVTLLMLLVLKGLLRNLKAALFAAWLLLFVLNLTQSVRPLVDGPLSAAWSFLVVAVLFRLGLLASAVMLYVHWTLARIPLTTDLSSWYSGSSLLCLALIGGLAVYGFVVSLGGKPLFGRPMLEE